MKTKTSNGKAGRQLRVQRVVRRTVQLYQDADYVRFFEDPEDYATADFKLGYKNKGCRKTADAALAKFGIKRTTRWQKCEWGYFARVSAPNDQAQR